MSDVSVLQLYPGFDGGIINRCVDDDVRAIILIGYKCGTLNAGVALHSSRFALPLDKIGSEKYVLLGPIEYATKKGAPVFLIPDNHMRRPSQQSFDYITTHKAEEKGLIPLKESMLSFPAVYQELEKILSETGDYHTIVKKMLDYCKKNDEEEPFEILTAMSINALECPEYQNMPAEKQAELIKKMKKCGTCSSCSNSLNE